jgi:hypothetical protein
MQKNRKFSFTENYLEGLNPDQHTQPIRNEQKTRIRNGTFYASLFISRNRQQLVGVMFQFTTCHKD